MDPLYQEIDRQARQDARRISGRLSRPDAVVLDARDIARQCMENGWWQLTTEYQRLVSAVFETIAKGSFVQGWKNPLLEQMVRVRDRDELAHGHWDPVEFWVHDGSPDSYIINGAYWLLQAYAFANPDALRWATEDIDSAIAACQEHPEKAYRPPPLPPRGQQDIDRIPVEDVRPVAPTGKVAKLIAWLRRDW